MNNYLTSKEVEKLTGVPLIRTFFLRENDCFPPSEIMEITFLWFFKFNIQVWKSSDINNWLEELKINPKLEWGVKTEQFKQEILKPSPYMRIQFPGSGSVITGESGDDIGRGGSALLESDYEG